MPLSVTRLGPYDILALVGSGGFGEVYKARDTRLDRTVAIKILPSADHELKTRFEREAKAIAALQHPHICTLFDVGHQDGTDYLVLEYLEGETLAQRLERGELKLDDALKIAIEIADALDKAHRAGIVHRDLKPGNIMLTKGGVKLVDFGLAKLRPQTAVVSGFSVAATATTPPITSQGSILGTLQYMAPEQLNGEIADARSDIFSFGCVLYEMVTGRKAFTGKTQASVIAAVLASEPQPMTTVAPMTPPGLEHVIKTCLAKDPDGRFHSAHDLQLQLQWIGESGSQGPQAGAPAQVAPRRRWQERLGWIVAAALVVPLIAAMAVVVLVMREKPDRGPTARFHFAPPEKVTFAPFNLPLVSPDGGRIAFTGVGADGQLHLWIRPLDSLSSEIVPGTEGAYLPFWSPDSKSIGFFTSRKLKRSDLSGGQPQTLCDAQGPGGAWNSDGVMLFAGYPPDNTRLYRVSAAGGEPKPVTELDPSRQETGHFAPEFLPDGRHFLYYAASSRPGNAGVYVGSLDSKEKKRIVAADSQAVYSPAGYVLYVRGSSLMAQPFDLKRLEIAGAPVPVADDVAMVMAVAAFSVSHNGVLAYRSGSAGNTELIWLDRHGNREASVGPPARYSNPSLSPDGARLAVGRVDEQTPIRDLWVFDLKRGTSARLTSDAADDFNPVWSLDGSRIFFTSNRKGQRDLYEKSANGTGNETVVLESQQGKNANDLSPDGRYLIYDTASDNTRSRALWVLPLFGDRKPFLFVQGEPPLDPTLNQAQFSPNGHFIAYASDESRRSEVYVLSFPEQRGKWPISTDGGLEPMWRRDGKELFYIAQNKLMAVEVQTNANAFQAGIPKPLFQIPSLLWPGGRNHYVVTADGQRFLFNGEAERGESSMVNVVLNWQAALAARESR